MIVGIVGLGFVGGALKTWLEEHNPHIKVIISDPFKGYNDDMSQADIIFISIHIPTEKDGSQNLDVLSEIVSTLPNKPIFIRTTLLPGTCDMLSEKYNKKISFMPEFLTERTAYSDFSTQPMIFTANVEMLREIFIGKKYIEMSSLEAEITKYAHNVFGALKVTYFNGIYEMCQKCNADYKKIQEGVLLSGYINAPHTQVPGPDGKFGYGGKCFPKDVTAFAKYTQNLELQTLLQRVESLNTIYRSSN